MQTGSSILGNCEITLINDRKFYIKVVGLSGNKLPILRCIHVLGLKQWIMLSKQNVRLMNSASSTKNIWKVLVQLEK